MAKELVTNNPFFAEYFQGVTEDIFLLPENESIMKWWQLIDENSSSYFDLNDNNWIISSKKIKVGLWMDPFNSNTPKDIEMLLQNSFKWDLDSQVFFCINRTCILEATWKGFTKNWIMFLQLEDDCPIILNPSNKNSALIVSPVGFFIKVEGSVDE